MARADIHGLKNFDLIGHSDERGEGREEATVENSGRTQFESIL